MTNITLSPASRDRLEIFLANLLDYVNHRFKTTATLHEILQEKISFNWTGIDETKPKLIVKSTLEFLLEFTDRKYKDTAKENLKHDIYILRDKLNILEDSRTKKQGNSEWHFTLTLWDRTSNDKNLTEFRQLWELTKNDKPEPSPPKNPEPVNDKPDEVNNNLPSKPGTCIIYNSGTHIENNLGAVTINNTISHAIEQTKEILKMDVLNNIQNMDARLDLIHEALAPDFFLNQSTAKSKLK